MENWLKLYNVITKSGYLNVLIKNLKTLLVDDEFEKKLDNNKGKLAFQNGIMDLETGVFRYGIEWDDYITDTIHYDYVETSFEFIKSKLLLIMNNNVEHLEYFLSIIGYSFVGDAELEKALYFMIDKTEDGRGNNGKTLFFDVLCHLMPYYVYKTKSTLIVKGNTKVHKQLVKMKGKRLVWLEELPKELLNPELIKELADGKTSENEVMFGTSEDINILFKMFVLSNNIPKIDDDEEAVYNRFKQVSFNSHFDTSGERVEADYEKLEFIADKELAGNIKDIYYNEVFNLIIHYAHKYYANKLPKVPSQFLNDTKDTKNKNDKFMKWFESNCIKDEDKKIAIDFIIEQTKIDKETIKRKMKTLGIKYNKDLGGIGKSVKGKYYKGGFEGVGLDDDEEE
jgi:phage/plasmid-associated DNA primase